MIPTRCCLIFGTQENLLKHSELDTIYADGTFSTCPSLFCQLFTILLTAIVKEEMQNSGLTLQPSAVMADFEHAFLQAVELQFPSI